MQVDPDEPLFDAGLSSMQAIELLGKLEDILGTDLPGSLLFEYPSGGCFAPVVGAQQRCACLGLLLLPVVMVLQRSAVVIALHAA